MNCITANNIDIEILLKDLGINPVKRTKNCLWYFSPFRKEHSPSLKVENNQFHDFGSGQHGRTLDIAILIWNCNISEALKRLSKIKPDFYFPKQNYSKPQKQAISIINVMPIQSKPLFAYLWHRGINPGLGKENLKEVVFSCEGGRPQYALGFQSNSGSWELRNAIFQGSTSPKHVTFISNNKNKVSCYEGFMDYLSHKQMRPKIESNFIVLNSTNNLSKAIPILKQHDKIDLYFDNDDAGRKATIKITEEFKNKVTDFSCEYWPFNDLNDFLINKKKI